MSSAPFPKSFAVLTMLLVGLLCTCAPSPGAPPEIQAGFPMDTLPTPTLPLPAPIDYDTTEWMEIVRHDPTILLDIRYATDSNFHESGYLRLWSVFLPTQGRGGIIAGTGLPAGTRAGVKDV
jgi:hypothetical protein